VNILVDSSVWIDYFRGRKNAHRLDELIFEDLVCVNDLILAELVPFLRVGKQDELVRLLRNVYKVNLTIDWQLIMEYQTLCLRAGINKVGISDLIVLQNCIKNDLHLFTFDRHFHLMSRFVHLKLW
jgi:predicted nucleic acid-binding protein